MVALTDRVERLESIIGEGPDDDRDLVTRMAEHEEQLLDLRHVVPEIREDLHGQIEIQREGRALLESLAADVQRLKEEVAALQRLSVRQAAEAPAPKVRVPEPKPFNGARDAKVLENFLWDIEQYFVAAKVPEIEKVDLAGMFLTDDAKLWWRTRAADDHSADRPMIADWETLKRELKTQFLPHNTAWLAREAMKKLRQTGSVRDYVKTFSSLLLDVPTMGEDDKLFNFTTGLQNWAQIELRRQGVRDLPSAMAVAESLADFRTAPVLDQGEEIKPARRPQSSKAWKRNKAEGKLPKPVTDRDDKPRWEGFSGCFICGGPHRARECPKKEKKVHAMTLQDEASNDSDGEVARVSPLQLVSAVVTKAPQLPRGLLYAKVRANGKEISAMLDTGSSSNFLTPEVARELNLEISPNSARVKAVNAKSVRIHGETKATLEVGPWKGECHFHVHPLDDFQMILGLEFLQLAEIIVTPHLKNMLVGAPNPTVVPLLLEPIGEVGAGNVQRDEKGKAVRISALVQCGAEPGASQSVARRADQSRPWRMAVHDKQVGETARRRGPWRGKRGCTLGLAVSTGSIQVQQQGNGSCGQLLGRDQDGTVRRRPRPDPTAEDARRRSMASACRCGSGDVQECTGCLASRDRADWRAAQYGMRRHENLARHGEKSQGLVRAQWKENRFEATWVKVVRGKRTHLEDTTRTSPNSGGGGLSPTS